MNVFLLFNSRLSCVWLFYKQGGEKLLSPHGRPPHTHREFTQALNPERGPMSTWLVRFAFLPIGLCSGRLATTAVTAQPEPEERKAGRTPLWARIRCFGWAV